MTSLKAVLLAFLLGSVAFAQAPTKQTEVTLEKDQTITGKKIFTKGAALGPVTFSQLGTLSPDPGTLAVVSDGTPGTVCSDGGTGVVAVYLNGAWNCATVGSEVDFASPPPLGNVTPNTVGATTVTVNGDGLFFQPQSNCIFEGADPTLHELEDVAGKLMWLPQGLGGPCTQILTYTPPPDGISPTDKQVPAWDAASGAFTIQNQTTTLPTAAAQGQVLVATGAGTTYAAQNKNAIDPRDYGVDCSDTNDSTTAWAAAVTAAGNYGKIVVPAHCLFKLTGTPGFSLYKVYGLEIEFAGRQGNGCDNQSPNPSGIDYRQAYAGGNSVISIIDSQRLVFRNLTIYTNGGADNGILLDQDGSTPPITTRNDFYNTCIVNNTASRNSSWKGISVSPVSLSNVENIHFYHPDVTCSASSATSASSNGYGIWFSGSANLKNEIVDDYNAHNCSVDIFTQYGGDITTQYGLSSNSFVNVALGGFNDSLYGFRSENATNAVSINNNIGPHLISHNDFAASAGTIIDCPSGCGSLSLFNNQTDSAPGNWFNVHSNPGSSGPLIAFGNRNFSWTPTDWQLGAFVQSGFSLTSNFPKFLLTPAEISGAGVGGNVQSPAIDLQSLSGVSAATDDYIIQNLPSGPLSNTPASSTLVFGHAKASSISPWLSFPGTLSGLTFGQITNTANLLVAGRGAAGSTSYSYQVVAHGNVGSTPASNTATIATGNATLNGTNFNVVQIPMVAGCTYFDIYRTASGGTPNSTGKIGTADCFSTAHPASFNASQIPFNDTGLAGDSATPPTINTTGVIDASLSPFIFLPLSAAYVATAQGNIGYDTTAKNWHVWQNAADRLMAVINGAMVNGNCVKAVVSGSTVSLQDAGLACGTLPTSAGYTSAADGQAGVDTSSPFFLHVGANGVDQTIDTHGGEVLSLNQFCGLSGPNPSLNPADTCWANALAYFSNKTGTIDCSGLYTLTGGPIVISGSNITIRSSGGTRQEPPYGNDSKGCVIQSGTNLSAANPDTALALSTSTSGGTIATGITVSIKYTYVNAAGETTVSPAASVVTGAGATNSVTIVNVPYVTRGGLLYNIYCAQDAVNFHKIPTADFASGSGTFAGPPFMMGGTNTIQPKITTLTNCPSGAGGGGAAPPGSNTATNGNWLMQIGTETTQAVGVTIDNVEFFDSSAGHNVMGGGVIVANGEGIHFRSDLWSTFLYSGSAIGGMGVYENTATAFACINQGIIAGTSSNFITVSDGSSFFKAPVLANCSGLEMDGPWFTVAANQMGVDEPGGNLQMPSSYFNPSGSPTGFIVMRGTNASTRFGSKVTASIQGLSSLLNPAVQLIYRTGDSVEVYGQCGNSAGLACVSLDANSKGNIVQVVGLNVAGSSVAFSDGTTAFKDASKLNRIIMGGPSPGDSIDGILILPSTAMTAGNLAYTSGWGTSPAAITVDATINNNENKFGAVFSFGTTPSTPATFTYTFPTAMTAVPACLVTPQGDSTATITSVYQSTYSATAPVFTVKTTSPTSAQTVHVMVDCR